MNKKIKQIAVFLVMLALGLTLTSCFSNKDTKKATPKKFLFFFITYVQAPLNLPSIVKKAIWLSDFSGFSQLWLFGIILVEQAVRVSPSQHA